MSKSSGFELLTEAENNVVNLLCQGMSNREIAKKLKIAETTVKVHLWHVYKKLKVNNRTKVVVMSLNS